MFKETTQQEQQEQQQQPRKPIGDLVSTSRHKGNFWKDAMEEHCSLGPDSGVPDIRSASCSHGCRPLLRILRDPLLVILCRDCKGKRLSSEGRFSTAEDWVQVKSVQLHPC